MTTPNDIISLALRDSGVLGIGQQANGQDMADGLTRLNFMLSQWNRKRWLVYHLIDAACVCTGAVSYSVGAGGNFNVSRPDRLQAAYVRLPASTPNNPQDYPLRIVEAREDYSRIVAKQLGSLPAVVFYDAAFPLGYVYPWPVPTMIYELHLILKETLTAFTSLAQQINLPPEYVPALHYGLCARLRPAYGLEPDPTITALADDGVQTLRQANSQIPLARMPTPLRRRGAWYNGFADRSF